MTAVVFLGPTLPRELARERLDAVYLGPVMRGDILRALSRSPDAIGIVDGFFELVPSVWHKEILVALSRGVRVYGAASMGALRAAELDRFGMIGVGQIYDWYASRVLEDDDEVAITHGPEDSGYRELSDAMVNIRDVADAAAAEGIVSAGDAERLKEIAKGLYYPERCYRRVLGLALAEGFDPRSLDALAELSQRRVPLKRRDAVLMLDRMARRDAAPPPAVDVEYTVFLHRLKTEVERG